VEHPAFGEGADTVGAGDAFTAALVPPFLAGASLAEMSGSREPFWILGGHQVGAMPVPDAARLENCGPPAGEPADF